MDEPRNLGLAAAVAGGYLLGRGKKGQMALVAAALLAGRGLRPGASGDGDGEGGASPDSSRTGHGGTRGRVGTAARGAAASVANRGITALTDALHERTLGLNDADAGDEVAEPEGEPAPEPAKGSDIGEGAGSEDTARGSSAPAAPKRTAKKAASGKRPAKKAVKAAAKKPTATKAPAGKKAAPARKTTARKNQSTQKAAPRTRRER
ncbi:hypothetical protein SAMN05216223_1342 [Actinacidiphila yanglinensis]|uniref:Histone protein n=1 Tax=Actinacidiphila yanglinensis TaxID=310779 RepID=A0A1H6ECL6_9ACTN|nr:hypothetical protein [Actinacidiphila yanglinensis]SEG95550.1 hypothetical protein SAMN05216223_1342 [Actinacidiphila yanglinensis]